MLDYAGWKTIHFLGIFLLFLALGGALTHAVNGGTREDNRARGLLAALHGVGLLFILLGGFGMLGKMGAGFPGWVHPKLLVWLLMGGALAVATRKPALAKPLWIVVPLLGLVAAWFGGHHGA